MCDYCNSSKSIIATVNNAQMFDDKDITAETSMCSRINEDGNKEYYLHTIMYYIMYYGTLNGRVGTNDDKMVPIKYCPFCGEKF